MSMISLHTSQKLQFFKADTTSVLALSYIEQGINAGFPSPADDFLDISIDLNKELIQNKDATYFARVSGTSMIDAGINDGDLLIIDKSIAPSNGKAAVCFIDGEFTIKWLNINKDVIWLTPANKNFDPIKVTKDNDFIIYGIITYIIKKPQICSL